MHNIETIPDFLHYRLNQDLNQTSVGKISHGEVVSLDYEQYKNKIISIANSLYKNGLRKGDHIAIMANTSLEWHLTDMACLWMGAVVIPIYPNISKDHLLFILKQTTPKFIFTDSKKDIYDETVKEVLKSVENIYLYESNKNNKDTKGYDEFQKKCLPFYSLEIESTAGIEQEWPKINSKDVATIIYTSGTTGVPKGAVITHEGLVQLLKNLYQNFQGSINPDDVGLCFLPLSHVLGRCDSLLHLPFGVQIFYTQNVDQILKNIQLLKPTYMLAVPRVFEKIYLHVLGQIESEGLVQQKIFQWAEEVSNDYFERLDRDLAPSTKQLALRQIAYQLVYSKIYEQFGGRIRFFVSGGAPLSEKIIKFMRNANLTILEGYGLSETIGPCTVSPMRKQIPGTVGLPFGDVKIKIAEDGEILIQTKAMFTHYYQFEQETQKSLIDGWFHTGDIGEITQEGFLKITDRKKDIIITSTGKNIAPQLIENMMNAQKYISSFMVIGNNKKFLTAVVGIEKHDFVQYFDQWEIEPTISYRELSKHPEVIYLIDQQIQEVNQKLSKHEAIKKFTIAPFPISIESGYLTPSMKLKRKKLFKEMVEDIEKMYEQDGLDDSY